MSTATRLNAYYEAEAAALKAQSLGKGDRNIQRADLETIRKTIKELEAQLAAENRTAAGQAGPVLLRGAFTGGFCDDASSYDERCR
ncbi:hypothetical protein [Nevskia sp.]|uniref:hypothetical protein n=1 Tax=Nevskia sp. TaxID=1929292 RepID=UPI0025F2CE1B|nr:hypothetical protein [Nevskia sp.]